jgi:hypothetical protein
MYVNQVQAGEHREMNARRMPSLTRCSPVWAWLTYNTAIIVSADTDSIGQADHASTFQAEQDPAHNRHEDGDESDENDRFAFHNLPHLMIPV